MTPSFLGFPPVVIYWPRTIRGTLCSSYKKYKNTVHEPVHRRSGCLPNTGENSSDPCCDRDHIAPFMELQRQVVIELERMERMPDQIDQLPELLAVAYP